MSHPFITRIYVASFAGIRSRGSCVGIHLEPCSPLVNVSSLVQVVAMRGRRGYALSIGRVRRFEGKFDLRRLFSALLPCLECWQSLIFPAASVSLSSFAYLLFVSSLPAVCWESLSILKRKSRQRTRSSFALSSAKSSCRASRSHSSFSFFSSSLHTEGRSPTSDQSEKIRAWTNQLGAVDAAVGVRIMCSHRVTECVWRYQMVVGDLIFPHHEQKDEGMMTKPYN